MAAGQWFIQTSPRKGTAEIETEHFGDDFVACLARAKALVAEHSATHHIRVHAPPHASDQQRRQVRQAGFEIAF